MAAGSDSHIRELFSRLEALVSELKEAFSRLEEQAFRDELTGLYNRRALDRRLEEEVHRALRQGHAFSLLFIDVDDFKELNDAFGHGMGDEVLKEIGGILVAHGRAMDLFFRYGGEEFVALLPGTKLKDALKVGERIRQAVAEYAFLEGEAEVTVSVGVAAYPDHGEDVATLLRAADQAQYDAKGRGKNQVYTVGGTTSDDGASTSGESRPLPVPPRGEARVAVGFSQENGEPSALWIDGEMHPIESLSEITARLPGVGRRYLVGTQSGRFELFRRNREWFIKPL